METAGQILKEKRAQKNISLEEAQKITKIDINILKNFEEDRFDGGLGSVYTKSLLKLYAKFLGEDPAEIIKKAGFEDASKQKNAFEYNKITRPKKTFSFKLPVFKLPKVEKKTLIFVVSIIAIYFIGVSLVKMIKGNKEKTKVQIDQMKEIVKKIPIEKKKKEGQLQPISLGIRAKSNCWIKVVVDGEMVFQGVLRKNKVESWEAGKIINLSIADAWRLEVEVNGKIIGPLGRKGQTVKDIEITTDGIVVGD